MMQQNTHFDVIIIGGSYAGLSCAMALGRALRSVLVIDSGHPCNQQTPHSHNFLTHDGKTPKEISALARSQVSEYNTATLLHAFANSVKTVADGFEVSTKEGHIFTAKKVVLASGIKDVMPTIPGFAECWGISVLHCPYCHGYEVRHQKTGILANGEAAYELAMLISNWTKDLTVYTNGPSAINGVQADKLRSHKIAIHETEIARLHHNTGVVDSIEFIDGTTTPIQAIYARPAFVQHSDIPGLLGCDMSAEGYVKIDGAHHTSVHGVYACGDNTTKMRTVSNAVAMGTATAFMVNKDLIEEEF